MSGGRARAVAACALVLALAGPVASAGAAPNLEIGMEDERLLLSEPVQAEGAIAGMAAAGVDIVRIHARWIEVSPRRDARAGARPASTSATTARAATTGRRSTARSTSRARPGCA